MVSIKWGAINSQTNIGSYQECIFNEWLCFIVSRIVIIYIIKKHNPNTSKFKYLYYFSCILNIIHSPDLWANKVQKQDVDEILLMSRRFNIGIIWIYKRGYTQKWLKRSKIPLINVSKNLIHNSMCFWIKLSIFRKNLKTKVSSEI